MDMYRYSLRTIINWPFASPTPRSRNRMPYAVVAWVIFVLLLLVLEEPFVPWITLLNILLKKE